ncbi:MAG: hypothetical protein A2X49_04030 [Lentisphaerae bacterium GWF2_52_8]|nr:MAG: hypothetical protein A2X49_04030 [Lentisphaerae bacterium GWF2_52_8]
MHWTIAVRKYGIAIAGAMMLLGTAGALNAQNLLSNGSFENGFEGIMSIDVKWATVEMAKYYAIDKSGPGGKSALVCTAIGGDPARSLRIPAIALDSAKTYSLTVAMKTEKAEGVNICVVNKGWTWNSPNIKPDATSDWKDYTIEFQPKESDDGKYQLAIKPQVTGKLSIANIRLVEKK